MHPRPFMRRGLIVATLLVIPGCVAPWQAQADEAYRVVRGPASVAITSPTVSMTVQIEETGRFWSGPDYDTFYEESGGVMPSGDDSVR